MTEYRVSLDLKQHPVAIAHLLPGDTLTVQCPGYTRTVEPYPTGEFTWIIFHCDAPGPRTGYYLGPHRLALGFRVRKRHLVTRALREIRKGGVARLEYGPVQITPALTERGPVAFTVIDPEVPATTAA